jgi:hypothetical protein
MLMKSESDGIRKDEAQLNYCQSDVTCLALFLLVDWLTYRLFDDVV